MDESTAMFAAGGGRGDDFRGSSPTSRAEARARENGGTSGERAAVAASLGLSHRILRPPLAGPASSSAAWGALGKPKGAGKRGAGTMASAAAQTRTFAPAAQPRRCEGGVISKENYSKE